MCDGVKTLRHIFVDEIGICDHGIICPEEHRPPCAKGGELSNIVAAHLICCALASPKGITVYL